MIRKQIYLDEFMVEQIKEVAERMNISQSELIRQSIRKYIQEEQEKGKVKDPLLEMVGLFSVDITDGSIDHDKYIYGVEKDEK